MKTSIDALYTLIKSQNPGLTLAQSQLAFSAPVRVTAEEYAAHSRNTKITLSAASGVRNPGSVDVFYDRLLLKDLLIGSSYGNPTPGAVTVPTGTTYAVQSDVLPYLNTHYGTTLIASDINASAPVDSTDGGYMTINPGNPAYDGQCWIDYPIQTPTDLATAVSVPDIGEIYAGAGGMVNRAANANNATLNAFWMDLTASNITLLDGATSAAHGGAEYSADLAYTNIDNAYTGTATVYYKRISFASAFGQLGAKSATYKLPAGAVNSVDLLPVINARTGLALTANDIVDEALPALVSGTASYTLLAAAGSATYTGSLALTLVDTLPDVATLVSTSMDLADAANATPILQRIWTPTVFTDNDYNWLRLSSADGYDPTLPLYTVNPAVTSDSTTQSAHGGREAAVTLTFHEPSGVTGELTFYFNRYNLTAVNAGAPVPYLTPDLSLLLLRSNFSNALTTVGGPSFDNIFTHKEIVDFDGMVFVNTSQQIPVVFAAAPGSAMFVGQAELLVSEGTQPPQGA